MNVRGVSCVLAVLCLLGLVFFLSDCSRKPPSGTTPDEKQNEQPDKQPGNEENQQALDADSGKYSANGGQLPVEARTPTKRTLTDDDPPTVQNKDSGSSLKRKLRGPKIGNDR